jgi:hypothetical protein
MDEDDLHSRVMAHWAARLMPQPETPRLNPEPVGRTYDGKTIFRAHDGHGRYSLFCDEVK